MVAANQGSTVTDAAAELTAGARSASSTPADPPAAATETAPGTLLPAQARPEIRTTGDAATQPSPGDAAQPGDTVLRRRQDAGDLVVRAGTAFEEGYQAFAPAESVVERG